MPIIKCPSCGAKFSHELSKDDNKFNQNLGDLELKDRRSNEFIKPPSGSVTTTAPKGILEEIERRKRICNPRLS